MDIDVSKLRLAYDTFVDEKLTQVKNQHRVIILVVIVAAMLGAFYFLFHSPKQEEIKGLKGKKQYLLGEIAKVEATVAKLEEHRQMKKETEEKFKEASALLPGEKEIPALLDNISSQGTNSGLNVLSFKPKGEQPKQFYADIPVDLEVQGPYHNVGVFLDKVSKLNRIVTVNDLTMGSGTKQDDEMHLKTKISLLTYRFIEQQAAPAAQGRQAPRRR